jgi:hypothetical protein
LIIVSTIVISWRLNGTLLTRCPQGGVDSLVDWAGVVVYDDSSMIFREAWELAGTQWYLEPSDMSKFVRLMVLENWWDQEAGEFYFIL